MVLQRLKQPALKPAIGGVVVACHKYPPWPVPMVTACFVTIRVLDSCLRPGVVMRAILSLLIFFLLAAPAQGHEGELRFCDLGDLRLVNNQVLQDCRIGYRTLGQLNADKSNVVLFPTWFAGTTKELLDTGMIGPGKLIDSDRFFVVALESLGNGVSSSPSNSKTQSRQAFPKFSIEDMVNAAHLLLTRELRLDQVYAVVGISMGGMQAFQWMVSYPDFLKRAVSIVGTPRMSSSDLLLINAEVMAIQAGRDCGNAGLGMKTVSAMHSFALRTPRYIAAHTAPEEVPDYLAKVQKSFERYSADDWEWQLNAILTHDIYQPHGGTPQKIPSRIRATALVVVSLQDQLVNPDPSRAFAGQANARLHEISSDCGHTAFLCEREAIQRLVSDFLAP